MKQGTSEFDQGYHYGRQELLNFLLNSSQYRELKGGDFCITLDTLQKILKEEVEKHGKS